MISPDTIPGVRQTWRRAQQGEPVLPPEPGDFISRGQGGIPRRRSQYPGPRPVNCHSQSGLYKPRGMQCNISGVLGMGTETAVDAGNAMANADDEARYPAGAEGVRM